MFEVSVQETFAAAHFLRGYQGKCERLHGHNYRVEVTVAGEKLDSIGMLCDFVVIKRELRKLLERLEGIVRESVKPMEKIDGIRILHVEGLAGAGGGGSASRSPTDEVIESALRYRVQAPLIDEVLKEIGIEGGNLAKMGGLIREASDMQRIGKAEEIANAVMFMLSDKASYITGTTLRVAGGR